MENTDPIIKRLELRIISNGTPLGFSTSRLSLLDAQLIADKKAMGHPQVDHLHILKHADISGLSQYGGGIAVSNVKLDSPASVGRLKVWDFIVRVSEQDVRLMQAHEITALIQRAGASGEVKLSILRSSHAPTVPVDVPIPESANYDYNYKQDIVQPSQNQMLIHNQGQNQIFIQDQGQNRALIQNHGQNQMSIHNQGQNQANINNNQGQKEAVVKKKKKSSSFFSCFSPKHEEDYSPQPANRPEASRNINHTQAPDQQAAMMRPPQMLVPPSQPLDTWHEADEHTLMEEDDAAGVFQGLKGVSPNIMHLNDSQSSAAKRALFDAKPSTVSPGVPLGSSKSPSAITPQYPSPETQHSLKINPAPPLLALQLGPTTPPKQYKTDEEFEIIPGLQVYEAEKPLAPPLLPFLPPVASVTVSSIIRQDSPSRMQYGSSSGGSLYSTVVKQDSPSRVLFGSSNASPYSTVVRQASPPAVHYRSPNGSPGSRGRTGYIRDPFEGGGDNLTMAF